MKNLLKLCLILLVVTTSCQNGGQQKKAEKTNDDGTVVKVKNFNNDPNAPVEWKVRCKVAADGSTIREGESIRYSTTGKVYERINYVNDKKEGKRITYHSTGKIYKEDNYSDNKLDGLCKRYDRKGNLIAEFSYGKGYPSVGLKEYTNLGKERTEPTLKVIKEDLGNGTYKLSASLTGENVKRIKGVKYYRGLLVDNKYFHKNLTSASPTSANTGSIRVSLNEVGSDRMVNVVAKAVTTDGFALILQKKVKL